MRMSLRGTAFHNYCSLAQLAMRMLHNRELIVDKKLNEVPIEFLCRDFFWNMNKLLQDCTINKVCVSLSNIQLKLIREVIKMLGVQLHGAAVMARTCQELKSLNCQKSLEAAEIITNFQQLSWAQFKFPEIFKTSSQDETFHRDCLHVMQVIVTNKDLLNKSMRPVASENIGALLIQSTVSRMIQMDSESLDNCVKTLTLLLNADADQLHFIETKIIQGIVSSNFWLSLFCFHIYTELLMRGRIGNKPEGNATERSNFFKNLLGTKLSLDPTSVSGLYIASIIQLISETPKALDVQHRFVLAFQSMILHMTSDCYYELNISLKLLADSRTREASLTQETMNTLGELIKFVDGCDWELYADLVISLMDAIISVENELSKLNLMIVLHPALSRSKVKPMRVKLKLVDLLINYIPIAKRKIGLPLLLTKELNKILQDEDLNLKRILMKKLSKVSASEFAEKLNISSVPRLEISESKKSNLLRMSKDFEVSHECRKLSHNDEKESPIAGKLQLILAYSAKLRDKHLSNAELDIARQIASNFRIISERD